MRLTLRWRNIMPPSWQLFALGVAIILAAMAANAVAPPPVPAGPLWASRPILLAVLLCAPIAFCPAFLMAGLAASLVAFALLGRPMSVSLSLINVAEVAAAAALLRRMAGAKLNLAEPAAFRPFLLVAVVAVPAVAALPAALRLSELNNTPYFDTVQLRYLTDALGMLVMAPAALAVLRGDVARLLRARGAAASVALMAVLLAVSIGVFSQSQYSLKFLIPPPLILLAARTGEPGLALAMPMLTAIVLYDAGHQHRQLPPMAPLAPTGSMFLELAFLAVCVGIGRISAAAAAGQASALRQYRQANERLTLATEIGGLGIWEWDVQNDVLAWDDRMAVLYGTTLNTAPLHIAGWFDRVHEQDRDAAEKALSEALAGTERLDLEFRIRRDDGEVRHIRAAGLVRWDAAGRPTHMTGINWDVTRRALATTAVLERDRRLKLERHRADAAERAEAAATHARLEQLAYHRKQARDQAQHANEAKTRFLAGMTHELRTPLNGILGYAQLLRLDGGLTPQQDAYVDAMLGAGEHLVGMINAVLDLSQIEADRLELVPVAVRLRELAQACLDLVRPAAQAQALALRLVVDDAAPLRLIADKTRLRQVLVNLLGNAVKFTRAGHVTLRILPGAAHHVRLEVADTGPGVPAAQSLQLFQEFSRLPADALGPVEGSGLGLAITARLVQRMGGSVGFGDNPGGGAVFWVELPVGGADKLALALAASGAAAAQVAEPLRILVVDDDETNRIIAAAMLRHAGHMPILAEDGEAAVIMAGAEDFDVILMDIRMPGIDGLEAARRIRRLPSPRGDVPVVALTAQAFANQIERCTAAGMNDHLSKPLEHSALLAVLARVTTARPAATPPRADLPGGNTADSGFDEAQFRATRALLPSASFSKHLHAIATQCRALQLRLLEPDALDAVTGLVDDVHKAGGNAGTMGMFRLAAAARHFERAAETNAPDMETHLLALGDALAVATPMLFSLAGSIELV